MNTTGKELEQQIQDLSKQEDALEKRKAELDSELSTLNKGLESRKNAISTAMLDGKDYSKDQDAMQRDQSKADVLQGAISQADARLADLNQQHKDIDRAIGWRDFLAADYQLEGQLLETMQAVKEAVKEWEKVEPLMTELRSVGGHHGMNIGADDRSQQMLTIYSFIANWFSESNTAGLVYQIQEIERSYPAFLNQMREQAAMREGIKK